MTSQDVNWEPCFQVFPMLFEPKGINSVVWIQLSVLVDIHSFTSSGPPFDYSKAADILPG